MIQSLTRPLLAAGLTLCVMAPTAGYAQPAGNYRASYDGYRYPPVATPFDSRSIGIPGPSRVCIKWCETDDLPCDPPVYKQADGRCNYQR